MEKRAADDAVVVITHSTLVASLMFLLVLVLRINTT